MHGVCYIVALAGTCSKRSQSPRIARGCKGCRAVACGACTSGTLGSELHVRTRAGPARVARWAPSCICVDLRCAAPLKTDKNKICGCSFTTIIDGFGVLAFVFSIAKKEGWLPLFFAKKVYLPLFFNRQKKRRLSSECVEMYEETHGHGDSVFHSTLACPEITCSAPVGDCSESLLS
jgi:hypothetical protein